MRFVNQRDINMDTKGGQSKEAVITRLQEKEKKKNKYGVKPPPCHKTDPLLCAVT
jgi:hypothetical protein